MYQMSFKEHSDLHLSLSRSVRQDRMRYTALDDQVLSRANVQKLTGDLVPGM